MPACSQPDGISAGACCTDIQTHKTTVAKGVLASSCSVVVVVLVVVVVPGIPADAIDMNVVCAVAQACQATQGERANFMDNELLTITAHTASVLCAWVECTSAGECCDDVLMHTTQESGTTWSGTGMHNWLHWVVRLHRQLAFEMPTTCTFILYHCRPQPCQL